MKRYAFDPDNDFAMSEEEIVERLGITRGRVSQLIQSALRKLKKNRRLRAALFGER